MRVDLSRIRAQLEAHPPHTRVEGDGKRASVAAIVRERAGEAEVLLIRRADNPSDPWSGHMAFPGGRVDASDASILVTAERETREEIGLDLSLHGEAIARLPDVQAISRQKDFEAMMAGKRTGLTVFPFVFVLRGEPTLAPNHEVAETLWAPLGPMLRGELASTTTYMRDGVPLELPCFRVEDRVVWGLTYQMLQSLFTILR
jgi:8-oxo-dGTP pyrophosphatase MutT (NUDIX family)